MSGRTTQKWDLQTKKTGIPGLRIGRKLKTFKDLHS